MISKHIRAVEDNEAYELCIKSKEQQQKMTHIQSSCNNYIFQTLRTKVYFWSLASELIIGAITKAVNLTTLPLGETLIVTVHLVC